MTLPLPEDRSAKRALVISAPHSGAGKTLITLGLLRALKDAGHDLGSAKSGPDYIDPRFHEAASGAPCVNLDAWAMGADRIRSLAATQPGELLLIEGAMGLFDGAPDPAHAAGRGSTADLAKTLRAPVLLVVDAAKQAQTAAATVSGLMHWRRGVRIAGVILNRVGSDRHRTMIERVMPVPVLGALPRLGALSTPSRHLGLVQARELEDLEGFIAEAAQHIAKHVDIGAVAELTAPIAPPDAAQSRLPPPGQRIAIARDRAFGFAYPHMLDGWRADGASLSFFSPLANEAPSQDADFVFLPGGYPELNAEALANARNFKDGMISAASAGTRIYGECGGYMTLGEMIIDAEGTSHAMLGLLPLITSFAERKLHLGYRQLTPRAGAPWSQPVTGHEFHYASIISEGDAPRLFDCTDAMGNASSIGLQHGSVSGSFAHVIDALDPSA